MKNISKKSFDAFTMAEILLSLTIIGVVAAITLPSLTGNINERTWATQKKALFARMSQAFPLLDSINTFDSAEAFIAGALNTVTKVNNVCGAGNIADCGINPNGIATLNGDILTSFPYNFDALGITSAVASSGSACYYGCGSASTGSSSGSASTGSGSGCATGGGAGSVGSTAAFETGNGESVVLYYNPGCIPDQETAPGGSEPWFNYVCVNMMYDLNNSKGPNTVGKDIGFMTVFYPMDPVVVAPQPDINSSSSSACFSDEYRKPNKFEAASMALNNMFVSGSKVTSSSPTFLTSSKGSTSSATYLYRVVGTDFKSATSYSGSNAYTRCVKR